MKNVFEHKGYSGTVEYSAEDNILHGSVLGIRSMLTYEGQDVALLKADFVQAVDEYLKSCGEHGWEPEKPI